MMSSVRGWLDGLRSFSSEARRLTDLFAKPQRGWWHYRKIRNCSGTLRRVYMPRETLGGGVFKLLSGRVYERQENGEWRRRTA